MICVCCRWSENSNDRTSYRPCNLRLGPFYGVCNEVILIVSCRVELPTIVCCNISFAEVVRLDFCSICSQPLHIDFVEVVRLQHECTNDTSSRCCFHREGDLAKHNIEYACQGWGVTGLCDCEGDAIRVVGWSSRGSEGINRSFGKVDIY